MSLEQSDIEKIAWLARLAIDPDDIPNYARELTNILDLVAQMDQIETGHINPLAHPLDLSARLRADVVTETNQREYFQSIAPAVADGHYLVPKVIE